MVHLAYSNTPAFILLWAHLSTQRPMELKSASISIINIYNHYLYSSIMTWEAGHLAWFSPIGANCEYVGPMSHEAELLKQLGHVWFSLVRPSLAGCMYLHKLDVIFVSTKHLGLPVQQSSVQELVVSWVVQRLHLQHTQRQQPMWLSPWQQNTPSNRGVVRWGVGGGGGRESRATILLGALDRAGSRRASLEITSHTQTDTQGSSYSFREKLTGSCGAPPLHLCWKHTQATTFPSPQCILGDCVRGKEELWASLAANMFIISSVAAGIFRFVSQYRRAGTCSFQCLSS